MQPAKTKSRTYRRVFVKTPGGKVILHYRKRKPKKLTCASCKKPLHGIPHLIHSKFKDLPKTKKRPQRPYGGVLCSSCMRQKLIEKWYSK